MFIHTATFYCDRCKDPSCVTHYHVMLRPPAQYPQLFQILCGKLAAMDYVFALSFLSLTVHSSTMSGTKSAAQQELI